jgi:CRP/FNR family transcriptional regulator, cyclic AMP receptor protein
MHLGELSLFEPGAVRSATAETVEPATCLALQRTLFLGFLRAHPEAAIRMLGTLASHVRRLSQLVDDAYHLGLDERLAKRLLDLAAAHGKANGKIVDIGVPLTQSELAGMLGATRESVNKLLRWYSSKGLISVGRSQIRILQMDGLRRRAGEHPT